MFRTITEIKDKNKESGYSFFEKDTMNFFNSKIHRGVYGGMYFITSEQFVSSRGHTEPRMYTIRKAHPDGAIDTVDSFQQFDSLAEAKRHIKLFLLED